VDKIILTDCDGVLLDWEVSFRAYAARQGYVFDKSHASSYSIGDQYGLTHAQSLDLISRFNHSSDFESLPPWRDAQEVVKLLVSEGWQLVVITTAGTHPWTYGLRMTNLENVFGKDAIRSLHILPLHGDKGTELVKYKDTGLYWIEDKLSNAELGPWYGLNPLLMAADYNKNYVGPIPRVNTWQDIYRIINDTVS